MKRTTAHMLSVAPGMALAAPQNLGALITAAQGLINPLIGLLSGVAVLAFVWGIVKYIASAGDEKSKQSGKNIMIYGVIGLFVLFSFWGIVQFINSEIFG